MKNFIAALIVCFTLVTMSVDADAARRFGGGKSFGRTTPSFFQKAPASKANSFQQAPKQQATPKSSNAQKPGATAQKPSMMRNMLMGAAAALGIAGLLSMLGINSAGLVSLITGLVIAFALYMLFKMLFAKRVTANGPSATKTAHYEEPISEQNSSQYQSTDTTRTGSVFDQFNNTTASESQEGVRDVTPDNFDQEGFLTAAKENYKKLQEAWNTGNVVELSDFTTNDVFIAITHQLKERGNVVYQSNIIELNNELVGIAQEANEYLAVVRFTGKVDVDGEIEDFDESWTLVKPTQGDSGWLLAGIQQNA